MFEKNLPALFVKIEGSVSTNIVEFKNQVDVYIGCINKHLVTDEHFGIAERDIKFCKKTEQELVRAKEAALNQSADIKTTMDMLGKMGENIRQVRLRLEKLVKKEKENRKEEIISTGCDACLAHIKLINDELQGYGLPFNDYQVLMRDAIKGMKTIESMEEAITEVITEYQNVNNNIAELMNRNIEYLNKAKDNGYHFLFTDFDQYVHLDNEHVALMINNRIAEHKKIEEENRVRAADIARGDAERLATIEIAKQIAKHKKDAVEEIRRAKIEAEWLVGIEIEKQGAELAEAIKIAKIHAVDEERKRVHEEAERLAKDEVVADETEEISLCVETKTKQLVEFSKTHIIDQQLSKKIIVLIGINGDVEIHQCSDDVINIVHVTIESLKEIIAKVDKNT